MRRIPILSGKMYNVFPALDPGKPAYAFCISIILKTNKH